MCDIIIQAPDFNRGVTITTYDLRLTTYDLRIAALRLDSPIARIAAATVRSRRTEDRSD
jgi:hypothetical protein